MIETLAWIAVGASLVPAYRDARERSRSTLVALAVTGAVAIVLAAVAAFATPTWIAIAQEDGSVEWATFLAFVLAAGWIALPVRKRGSGTLFVVACCALAAFCVLVAGEEISWGQRLVGFKPPDVFLERNFQQELNLHNVLMDERGLGVKLESKHLVMAIALGFGLAWPQIVKRETFASLAPLAPPLALLPIFLGVVAAQLAYAVELTGEGAELVLGLGFLAAAIVATGASPVRVAAWLVAPIVLGAILSFAIARVVFGSDDEGTAMATAELAQLAPEIERTATPKLARKNIHKRVFTTIRDGYSTLERPRTDRHGYFLDPWNNPYWITFDRKTQTGWIYSFGPNRRRDLAVKRLSKPDADVGDDIVVRFQLRTTTAHDPDDDD